MNTIVESANDRILRLAKEARDEREQRIKNLRHIFVDRMTKSKMKKYGFEKWGKYMSHCVVSSENLHKKIYALSLDRKHYAVIILTDAELNEGHIALL